MNLKSIIIIFILMIGEGLTNKAQRKMQNEVEGRRRFLVLGSRF